MPKVEIIQRGDAGEHMKVVARRLFAQRCIDGVTVREIAEAAGQKNHAAVGYYYGSKEALVREIIRDGASMIEERRARWLAKLEADGGPHSVRDVVDVLVYPSIGLDGEGREESYARFFLMMAQNHRALYLATLAGLKQNFVEAEQNTLSSFIAIESLRHMQLFHTKDREEAFKAYLEKRQPTFIGR